MNWSTTTFREGFNYLIDSPGLPAKILAVLAVLFLARLVISLVVWWRIK